MSRGPCTFRQRDATKAVKAVTAAGCQVARVEIDREGKIIVIVGEPGDDTSGQGRSEWDNA